MDAVGITRIKSRPNRLRRKSRRRSFREPSAARQRPPPRRRRPASAANWPKLARRPIGRHMARFVVPNAPEAPRLRQAPPRALLGSRVERSLTVATGGGELWVRSGLFCISDVVFMEEVEMGYLKGGVFYRLRVYY